MRKIITVVLVAIALTGYAQEKKTEIAEMGVEMLVSDMQRTIFQEYSEMDTVLYEQETMAFINAIETAYNDYKAACDSTTITYEFYDSLIAELQAKMARFEAKFTASQLRRNGAYQNMKRQLEQYQETLQENPVNQINEWVQPTGAHDAYAKDAKVLHNGKEWINLIDANVWEPGVSGWREL